MFPCNLAREKFTLVRINLGVFVHGNNMGRRNLTVVYLLEMSSEFVGKLMFTTPTKTLPRLIERS